jgi:hypothetical protein
MQIDGSRLEAGDRLASLMPNRIDLVVHYSLVSGRVPLVLRSKEAGDRPRPLQHQPARGRGGAGRAPAIDLAGVVGIHDTVHGENVRAYVTLREGAERPSSADLIVHCRERVGYKAPEEIVFLDEMPLNPTGKIDRVGLKRMTEDHLHPHGP